MGNVTFINKNDNQLLSRVREFLMGPMGFGKNFFFFFFFNNNNNNNNNNNKNNYLFLIHPKKTHFSFSFFSGPFYFQSPKGKNIAKARGLRAFIDSFETVPMESIVLHLEKQDFTRWLLTHGKYVCFLFFVFFFFFFLFFSLSFLFFFPSLTQFTKKKNNNKKNK